MQATYDVTYDVDDADVDEAEMNEKLRTIAKEYGDGRTRDYEEKRKYGPRWLRDTKYHIDREEEYAFETELEPGVLLQIRYEGQRNSGESNSHWGDKRPSKAGSWEDKGSLHQVRIHSSSRVESRTIRCYGDVSELYGTALGMGDFDTTAETLYGVGDPEVFGRDRVEERRGEISPDFGDDDSLYLPQEEAPFNWEDRVDELYQEAVEDQKGRIKETLCGRTDKRYGELQGLSDGRVFDPSIDHAITETEVKDSRWRRKFDMDSVTLRKRLDEMAEGELMVKGRPLSSNEGTVWALVEEAAAAAENYDLEL